MDPRSITAKPASVLGRITGLKALTAGAVALLAAACNPADRVVTGSTVPVDYRERHPIILKQGAQVLDVFAGRGTGSLDRRQVADIHAFAADYRRKGRGGIYAQVPEGHHDAAYARHAVAAINRALLDGGAGGLVSVSSYHPGDKGLAAPIRLTFSALEAKVATKCGQWPADLGPGPTTRNWQNEPHYNLGCASQQNFAAMVADPLDLVRPRPEGRVDTIKRMRGIEQLRKGEDPSTTYRDQANQINQTVGTQ